MHGQHVARRSIGMLSNQRTTGEAGDKHNNHKQTRGAAGGIRTFATHTTQHSTPRPACNSRYRMKPHHSIGACWRVASWQSCSSCLCV